MKKIWFYIVASGIVLSYSSQLSAQTITSKNPDPSANNVSPILNHTVKKGETYYSLSKQYKTTVKALQDLNPEFPVLKTGAVIKVRPASANGSAINKTNNSQDSIKRVKESARVERTTMLLASDIDKAAVVVTILSGETLYSISKKYGISVDRIKNLNDLESDNLQVGQVLILPPEARKNSTINENGGLTLTVATNANSSNLITPSSNATSNSADLQSPTQQVTDKPVIVPNNAIAPNPVILSQKDSAVKVQNVKNLTAAATSTLKNSEANKRDAGGMPELGAKKKVVLKEYEKTVKVSVGQTGMDPERHWVLANNHNNGEVVALVNPETKTIVWCVVMGPAKGKSDSEIIISESLFRKLNLDEKKSKLIFRYAAP